MIMIKLTKDGTTTLYSQRFEQYYHSIFGARAETVRVFIELGLEYAIEHFNRIDLLEMGFGTGFNAMLTGEKALESLRKVNYHAIEAFPLSLEEVSGLNFDVKELHKSCWNEKVIINPYLSITKHETTLQEFQAPCKYNLVYFDAFPPSSQPELWTKEIFEKVASLMIKGGVLVTYCSKGYVQRNLKAAGFLVEKHSGPPRKREVLRAILK